jgi:hypothetical protein
MYTGKRETVNIFTQLVRTAKFCSLFDLNGVSKCFFAILCFLLTLIFPANKILMATEIQWKHWHCAIPKDYSYFSLFFCSAQSLLATKCSTLTDVIVFECNTVWTRRQKPTFRGNFLPPSPGHFSLRTNPHSVAALNMENFTAAKTSDFTCFIFTLQSAMLFLN